MFIDGRAVEEISTFIDRPDVSELGLPGQDAGFSAEIPRLFRDNEPHDLCFCFGNGFFLQFITEQGPFTRSHRFALAPDMLVSGYVDGLRGSTIRGWAMLTHPLTREQHGHAKVAITIDGKASSFVNADRERRDVMEALGGRHARYGFEFRPSIEFRDGQPHTAAVSVEGTELDGSPLTFQIVGDERQSRYVSCSPQVLYSDGGFHDQDQAKELLLKGGHKPTFTATVGEFTPAYSYDRSGPYRLAGPTQKTLDDLMAHFGQIGVHSSHGASSGVFKLTDVFVHDNIIYQINSEDDVLTLYETARPSDRPYVVEPNWSAEALRAAATYPPQPRPGLYLGSVGYINYGHWLLDDLAKVEALAQVARHAKVKAPVILLPGSTHVMNAIKEQSLRFMQPGLVARDIVYIPPDRPVHFDVLYYVSPTTYHPYLKSPEAIALLRDKARQSVRAKAKKQASLRLLVQRRPERGRQMINASEVAAVFRERGFQVIDPETTDFVDQVRLFSAAAFVAGPMGAAMANTVFCEPGTDLLYLVPDGWMEPFYWDLAAAAGHRYSSLFGASTDRNGQPHKADFTIDLAVLAPLLDELLETPPDR